MLIDNQMETLRGLAQETIPLPGGGTTAERHRRLFEIGRIDLSLARLAEAHWDAVAILAESGREARADCIYGVWASERPGQQLTLVSRADSFRVNGQKAFCSGAGLIDRALVTVGGIEQGLSILIYIGIPISFSLIVRHGRRMPSAKQGQILQPSMKSECLPRT